MLNCIKGAYRLFLVVLVVCPFSFAYANGDFCTIENPKFSNTKDCECSNIKKHKRPRAKKHSKKHYQPHEKKVVSQNENQNQSEFSIQRRYRCEESPAIVEPCNEFPERRVKCQIVNPADIVEFTCDEFSEKIKTCEAYSCQAPSVFDPSIKTNWKILGQNGDRCVVSNTITDVGIHDNDGNAVPITQTCEYDEIGIQGLTQRFSDLKNNYFRFSTCNHYNGIYNCTFSSRGQSIKDAKNKSIAQ